MIKLVFETLFTFLDEFDESIQFTISNILVIDYKYYLLSSLLK